MKKKILLPILLLLLTFSLFACFLFLPNNEYSSKDNYEASVISAVETIENSTVALVKGSTNSPTNSTANATIVKKDRNDYDYTYYAITIATIATEINELSVFIPGQALIAIDKYTYNLDYNIMVIVFDARVNLNVSKVIKSNQVYDSYLTQAVLSEGTDSNLAYYNTITQGNVTNNELVYNGLENTYFTHDASKNAGELGSGVYNLEGYLIGLNVERVYMDEDVDTEERILSLNYALKISEISMLFDNLTKINYQTHELSNNYLKNSHNLHSYNHSDLQTKLIAVNNEQSESVVRIRGTDFLASGLIIEKTLNIYRVLTVNVEEETNLRVIVNNKTYLATNVEVIDENYLSIVTFISTDNLAVYNLTKSISKLVHGQFVQVIGSVNNDLINSNNVGVLSKIDNEENENLFMHTTKANLAQVGAPIFNLEGNLIGIHIGKVNVIETTTRPLTAEGLSYAYKIEEIVKRVLNTAPTFKNYQSNVQYESHIIETTKETLETSVTIKTSLGHGSGVLFEKENIGNGQYRYSVLTNEHVISTRNDRGEIVADSEISIHFNIEDMLPIRATEYYLNSNADMGILRFISRDNLKIKESSALNGDEKIGFTKGQTVIAIGTPGNNTRSGYVSIGIMNGDLIGYNGQNQLGFTHTAQINSGNSGGPLFNLEGTLLAINVAKGISYPGLNGEEFAESIGISLNINKLSEIYNSVIIPIKYQNVPERSPRIGITVTPMSSFKEYYTGSLDKIVEVDEGIVVVSVDPLFDVYGKVLLFDVIIAVNGTTVKENADIAPFVTGKPFGYQITLTILRKGINGSIDVEVTLS